MAFHIDVTDISLTLSIIERSAHLLDYEFVKEEGYPISKY